MNAATTGEDTGAIKGWVYYDAACSLCVRGMRRWGGILARRGYAFVPLQTPGSVSRLGLSEVEMLAEMRMLLRGGGIRSGIDAWSLLLRSIWWLWPLGALLAAPGFREAGRCLYRWVARNRHCLGGNCTIAPHRRPRHRAATTFMEMP